MIKAAHLALTQLALEFRNESTELAIAAKNARDNAEALEEVICHGTDAEVEEALRLAMSPPGCSDTSSTSS